MTIRPSPPSATPKPHSSSHNTVPLVLKECDIQVAIIDVHSWVTFTQKFYNPSSSVANHVTYMFSMLAGAAIYGIEIIREDGSSMIHGVVKEKEKALKEMSAANNPSHTAALGKEVTKDVFTLGLGHVPGKEYISVKLSYMSPLTDDEEANQLRFTFPRSYVVRYGKPPAGIQHARPITHEHVPFTMNVDIWQLGKITSVASPSQDTVKLL
ncbi:hypothetical protein F5880DRAFT_1643493 [Lentinula raphanica]|nr:hypothetical protein F5880DRAFT_1643493 [Lentinula raphanica]